MNRMKTWLKLGWPLLVLVRVSVGAEVPKGLGLDEGLEAQLRVEVQRLMELSRVEKPNYQSLFDGIQKARKLGLKLLARKEGMNETTVEPDMLQIAAESVVACYEKVSPEEVLRLWREQLDYYLRSVLGMLDGDGTYLTEWCTRRAFRQADERVRPLNHALREAARVALLLSRPIKPLRLEKAEELFAEDFTKGTDRWELYGQCVTSNEGNAFRLRDERVPHPDAMMWTKQEFSGDFVVEFRFTPHTEGTSAGALFAICGRPRPGKTLAVCVGETMDTYNFGIDAYHFSMHRGTTGLGNVRRVGPGLMLLASGKDPCPEPGKEYSVAIGKYGAAIFLIVDGKLVHHYVDGGTYGSLLTEGHIGIRHWAGMDASYRDFRVLRLKERP